MKLHTRKMLDRAFSATGLISIAIMTGALVIILAPMIGKGLGAIVFTGTIEHRRFLAERFERGDRGRVEAEIRLAEEARAPVYRMMAEFERWLEGEGAADPAAAAAERKPKYRVMLRETKKALFALLGPAPGAREHMLERNAYGQTRWDRAEVKRKALLFREVWDYSDPTRKGIRIDVPRERDFAGTPLAPLFGTVERNLEQMLRPQRTVYWQFLIDRSVDSHMFGGIGHELLGTIYLAVGAMLFAVPMGLLAAIYLTEYARETRFLGILRTCINTLAGVPSIVFGLFGLAFFINWLGVSRSKSVLAGSLTLALMILPTLIRASEEAIRAVPRAYKEAALSLGAGRWHTVLSVILPAAMPGILTGIVISMGRAAGETAPIIFTAAVAEGALPRLWEVFSQPTPALSWNIYNLSTEHAAVDEIRHMQFGMVMVLVLVVLLLNLTAIIIRGRILKNMKG